MAINVSVNRPSTARLSTAPVSKQSAPTQVATAPKATQHNPFLQDTFTPARSGDPEGVDAARRLLPRLENTINTTGVLLDTQPDLAIPLAKKKLGELYAPDAIVFPGLAPHLGAAGVAALLKNLHSDGAQLQVGTSDGKSGVSEVYGRPDSTEEKGEFVMISRGTRGDDPYTTAEGFKYEKTPEGLRITEHTILTNIDENVPSTDPRLQQHLGKGGTAK
jgi:hypothetical protein